MKPFLKWAGGKYRLLSVLKPCLPKATRYIEPFIGSGAVFVNSEYPYNILSDSNPDLINLYQCLQADSIAFIDYCQFYFQASENQAERYYHWRLIFNQTTDKLLKAALFLYLNRHGYNGLCRYNSKGEFNVPFGRYKQAYFPQQEMLYFAEKLKQAELHCTNFSTLLQLATTGDVVYCDPPYLPLTNTANFTHYDGISFAIQQQHALVAEAHAARERGAIVIISNHDLPQTRALYTGAHFITANVRRMISANSQQRKKVAELIAIFN